MPLYIAVLFGMLYFINWHSEEIDRYYDNILAPFRGV